MQYGLWVSVGTWPELFCHDNAPTMFVTFLLLLLLLLLTLLFLLHRHHHHHHLIIIVIVIIIIIIIILLAVSVCLFNTLCVHAGDNVRKQEWH
jgi:drug/metabolite transporter (DMT)-like permease